MANVYFTTGTRAEIETETGDYAIVNGKILYEYDQGVNNKIYHDVDGIRYTIGGTVTVDSAFSLTSDNPIENQAITGVLGTEDLSGIGGGTVTDIIYKRNGLTYATILTGSWNEDVAGGWWASITLLGATANSTPEWWLVPVGSDLTDLEKEEDLYVDKLVFGTNIAYFYVTGDTKPTGTLKYVIKGVL